MSEEHSSRAGRRATDSAPTDAVRESLPVPTGPAKSAEAKAAPIVDPAFEAQLMTQGTIKRGLRGGQEVLDAARSSYLKTEWSGPADRRPRQGMVTKTKV